MTSIPLDELIELLSERVCEKLAAKETKEEKLLTSKQVCDLLSITAPTLNDRCSNGLIKKYRTGRKVLFKESEILASLQNLAKYKSNKK